ncbi:cellulose binding domain-containing protein, partial [Streptomyces sp. NPDC032472]|uniref:cellulose binding domain-containing protein n=1 Tax=Streptomyces sp. NPDC032472 TaxID=3155018 RepID=UPI0033F4CE03
MSRNSHRRKATGPAKAAGALALAAAVGGIAITLTGTAQAASVGAAFTKSSNWSTGYTGQYVITNNGDKPLADWTLEFDLPAGTALSSLWNGEQTVNGSHVTVKPPRWAGTGLAAGASTTIGFVTSATQGTPGNPTGCLINKVKCSAGSGPAPQPTGRPTTAPTAAPTPTSSAAPTASAAPTSPAQSWTLPSVSEAAMVRPSPLMETDVTWWSLIV